jgi:hypothetical protein
VASARLIRFVEGVARGMPAGAAAIEAGYSKSVAKNPGAELWSQPEAAALYRAAQKRHGRAILLDPPTRTPKPTVTYFLRDARQHVKIGKTSNLRTRLHSLRTASADPLTLALVIDGDREAEFHAQFSEYCIKGDWFTETGSLAQFLVDEQAKQDPAPHSPGQQDGVSHGS